MPPLWRAASSAQSSAGPAALWTMRLSGFGDGGHDFPGHSSAAAHLVSGDVVGDEPENRGECSGTAKHFGSGKLRHRLGAAAQAAASDGAAWPRTAHWPRRGRRDLCGGRRKGSARTPDAEKGAGGHRRRGRRCRDRKNPHEAHPPSFQATAVHGFIQEAVDPDSTIHTDGWEGYVGLEALGYRHEYDLVATSSQSASELLPRVHRLAALLKRWLMGTHQGAVSREHLDYYLDEYTFRFTRRRSRHRGKLFYRLVQQAAAVGPTTYSEMVQHVRGRRISQPQDMG